MTNDYLPATREDLMDLLMYGCNTNDLLVESNLSVEDGQHKYEVVGVIEF